MTKELIEKRAMQIAKACEYVLLHQDETDEAAGAGFRWGYLVLRRPRKYLEYFRDGDLRIDPNLLNEAFWHHGDNIDGPSSLLKEEFALLEEHNREATMYMKQQSNVISLVKTSSGKFA